MDARAPDAGDGRRRENDTYALFGWPLAHSASPAMHEAAFRACGMAASYVVRPTPPGQLPSAMSDIAGGTLAGANITMPHKVAALKLVDECSACAAEMGAINTVLRVIKGHQVRLRGENTDTAGFRDLLRQAGIKGQPGPALVLGAGGAARAVAWVLLRSRSRVTILARDEAQATGLVHDLAPSWPDARLSGHGLTRRSLLSLADRAAILVNATPVGSPPRVDDCLWPLDVPLPAALTVIDLVAWPCESRLVRHARSGGATAVGGLAMLVGQAAAAFELWTGLPAPVDTMRAAAECAVAEMPA
jgi:shikimate dehydrogenase